MSSGIDIPLFRNHHIIGGGYRDNNVCPKCLCTDRERWMMYILMNFY